MNEFFDLNSEESIRKVANGEFARSKRKHAYRATFKVGEGGGKFRNESESFESWRIFRGYLYGQSVSYKHYSSAPLIQEAVMQEDEDIPDERTLITKLKEEIIPSILNVRGEKKERLED